MRRSLLASLASSILLFACGPAPVVVEAPPRTAPVRTSPAVARDPHDPNAQTLALRAPFARSIRPKEMHAYEVTLEAGQVMFATVEQHGVDLVIGVVDPDGVKLAELDSPNGIEGPEPIKVIAKKSGVYRFEVRPGEWPGEDAFAGKASGDYAVHVDEIVSGRDYLERETKKAIASPRIFALWRSMRDEGPTAEDAFWKELHGKAPLVEPIDGDARGDVLVTFAWRGDGETRYVGMIGGPRSSETPLERLPGSDVWYLTARMPRDARARYAFVLAKTPPPLDLALALTTDRYDGGALVSDPEARSKLGEASMLELPDAPAEPWVEPRDVPHGAIVEEKIASEALHETRRLIVYTPPGFDPKATYPLVVAFDGDAYGGSKRALIPLPVIVDNLIAANKIPKVVMALVPNADRARTRDLGIYPPFAEHVAKEVVATMRSKHRATRDPKRTILTGSSLGGLASVFTALAYPEVFGNVLSQSGSFWFFRDAYSKNGDYATEPGAFIADLAKAPKRGDVRFWMEAGRFETGSQLGILDENRRLRDVLIAKRYAVDYSEFDGGHDYACWRGTIADGLIALLAKPRR